MRRITVFLFAFLFFICGAQNASAIDTAYVLTEASTGEVISEENADTQYLPAGTAKIMSFLIAFEAVDSGKISLSDKVTVSNYAASLGGTSVFLDSGSSYTVEELLRAAAICSANDAMAAVAEHVSGSEEAFVDEMNKRAAELGLSAAFTNCTGLPDNAQTASAKDMAKIACELSKHTKFFEYSSVWMDTFTHASGRTTEMSNSNRLIRTLTGCDGMSTGSSADAGYCGVFTLKSGTARFIAVVLGAPNSNDRFSAAQTLLSEANASYSVKHISKEGQLVKKAYPVKDGDVSHVNIITAEDCTLLLKKGEDTGMQKTINLPDELTAPITAGEKIGTLVVKNGDAVVAEIPLTVKEDITVNTFKSCINTILNLWLN